ncbi:MAG: hypothetical protein WAO08_19570, partial [Hyphomicrobiaceae bacterium]
MLTASVAPQKPDDLVRRSELTLLRTAVSSCKPSLLDHLVCKRAPDSRNAASSGTPLRLGNVPQR